MNLTKDILAKIDELRLKYPNATSVSFGKKIKDGEDTGEFAIRIAVKEKKPLSELKESEVIESEVTVDNSSIKTDVVTGSKFITTADCTGNLSYGGCGWFDAQPAPNNQANRQFQQSVRGGLSMTSSNMQFTVGTMGGVVTTDSGCIVGLTNNHVSIQDAFFTSNRSTTGTIQNDYNPVNKVYQGQENYPYSPNFTSVTQVGVSLRYVPIHAASTGLINQVDGAIFSISQDRFDANLAWQQIGLEALNAYAPQFATTNEIDNLLATNPRVYSSGRTTGPKGLMPDCPMVIIETGVAAQIEYNMQIPPGTPPGANGANWAPYAVLCNFNDCIKYAKPGQDQPNFQGILEPPNFNGCYNPVYSGDSGSMLLADINGTIKIIGLVFAGQVGGYTQSGAPVFWSGLACRIDQVANQLGIEAYQLTGQLVDPETIEYKTVDGQSDQKTIVCLDADNKAHTYWQAGFTNSLEDNCN